MVWRSWAAGNDDPEFWNPKLRLRSASTGRRAIQHPTHDQENRVGIGGTIQSSDLRVLNVAFDKKELPTPESGAMCYMLSKQAYLSDSNPHWHPT